MRKTRVHRHLDQALFVLLIMAGAVVSAVFDVRAISGAMASGRYGLGAGIAAAAPAPVPALAATSSPRGTHSTVYARLSN